MDAARVIAEMRTQSLLLAELVHEKRRRDELSLDPGPRGGPLRDEGALLTLPRAPPRRPQIRNQQRIQSVQGQQLRAPSQSQQQQQIAPAVADVHNTLLVSTSDGCAPRFGRDPKGKGEKETDTPNGRAISDLLEELGKHGLSVTAISAGNPLVADTVFPSPEQLEQWAKHHLQRAFGLPVPSAEAWREAWETGYAKLQDRCSQFRIRVRAWAEAFVGDLGKSGLGKAVRDACEAKLAKKKHQSRRGRLAVVRDLAGPLFASSDWKDAFAARFAGVGMSPLMCWAQTCVIFYLGGFVGSFKKNTAALQGLCGELQAAHAADIADTRRGLCRSGTRLDRLGREGVGGARASSGKRAAETESASAASKRARVD
jgi:hypothetical protein